MLREAGYPVGVACTVLALSHSSYYYHPEKKDEYELEEAIEQVVITSYSIHYTKLYDPTERL